MSGPDPHDLWIDDDDPARPVVSFQHYFWTGNRGNRQARASAILRRLRWAIGFAFGVATRCRITSAPMRVTVTKVVGNRQREGDASGGPLANKIERGSFPKP